MSPFRQVIPACDEAAHGKSATVALLSPSHEVIDAIEYLKRHARIDWDEAIAGRAQTLHFLMDRSRGGRIYMRVFVVSMETGALMELTCSFAVATGTPTKDRNSRFWLVTPNCGYTREVWFAEELASLVRGLHNGCTFLPYLTRIL